MDRSFDNHGSAPASRRRFLVTGCAGFVGSHLVEALLARGDEVVGLDAFTDYYARELKESNLRAARDHDAFSLVEGDVAEAELDRLLDGVAGVFHLAAQPGVRGSWGSSFALYAHDNLVATQALFEAAANRGVRVVFASSSSVYGNAEAYPTREDARARPISPYGVTKLGCEHLAHAYRESFGLEVVSLRYFTVYGPRQRPDMAFARLVKALHEGACFDVYGSGEQSRDFTFVADTVAATTAAMDAGAADTVYNVGGGVEASLRDVIELVERLSGRSLDVRYSGDAVGDVKRTAADTTRIRRELGWTSTVALAEGLAAQLESARIPVGRT